MPPVSCSPSTKQPSIHSKHLNYQAFPQGLTTTICISIHRTTRNFYKAFGNKTTTAPVLSSLSCLSLYKKSKPNMISFLKHSFILLSLIASSILTCPANSATESFIYGGCSRVKYAPGTPYESNVNSLLTFLVNSALSASFNEFKASVPGSGPADIVYGLLQCRGDLSRSECRGCVANAVGQLGTICVDSMGGTLQLDGCFIKYDNVSFFGTEDKSEAMKRCGPSVGIDSNGLTRRDALLDFLAGSGGQYFRLGDSGNFHGVAQCVQDLSTDECQNCLSDATGRLKSECASSTWGDAFLGKCYARFTDKGRSYTNNGSDNQVEKTLSITVGIIAGVALLIFFLSIISRALDRKANAGGK